jgi:glutamate 5-kinase
VTPRTRADIPDARRIVVKVGSSSISGENAGQIGPLVDALAAAHERGTEVVLVSSGAIATGMPYLKLDARPTDLATQQAAASVGQNLLVFRYQDSLDRYDIVAGQVLLTAGDLENATPRSNAQRAMDRLLALKILPIVNENDTVATHEIRFGDNDRLAALVAQMVHADLLVLLSDVDGLYDGNPSLPGSSLLSDVRAESDLASVRIGSAGGAGVGTGGMHTKVEAARIATGAGIPVVLTSAEHAVAALAGDPVGTLFHATGKRRPTRLLWLAHATEPKGTLLLDAGAVRAVTERRASLLAAGLVGVSGSFVAGDPVDLVDPEGRSVARGLVNFDAAELPALVGRSSHDLKRELGAAYEREVVHRDDLVLL